MKRIISLALSLLICLGAFAQQERIDEMLRHFRQGDRISLDFSFCQNGNSVLKTDGSLVLQGSRYLVKMGEVRIISDGKTQWTVDEISQEIYLEQSGGLLSFLYDPEYIKKSVSSLTSKGNSLSGVFTTGKDRKINIQFSLKNIDFGKASDDLSGFSFDCSDYIEPWVITDLR